MPALSSVQSGNLDDPATYGVGSIASTDTFTLNNGHTVSAVNNQTLGSSPATGGTAAIRVRQGATFQHNSGAVLTLNGDVRQDQGSTITALSGEWRFNPGSGVRYGHIDVDTGTGTPAATFGTSVSTPFKITKNSGAAGTVKVEIINIAPNFTPNGLELHGCGSATVDAFEYLGANGRSFAGTSLMLANDCGGCYIHFSSQTTYTLNLDALSCFNDDSNNYMLKLQGSGNKVSGTRRIGKLVLYSTANKGFQQELVDLSIEETVTVNNSIYSLDAATVRTTWGKVLALANITINGIFSPNDRSVSTIDLLIMSAYSDNPHYVSGSEDSAAGTDNVYNQVIMDGWAYAGSDPGDGFLPKRRTVIKRFAVINGAGVGVTLLNANGSAAIDRYTIVGAGCALTNVGETTGNAGQLEAATSGISYNTGATITGDSAFERETTATISNNGYYGVTGANRIESTYIGLPGANQIGNNTCTAGTDATHVVASGASFVTGGAAVGDFVRRNSDGAFARITVVTDGTHLTLASPGISGLVSTDVVTVRRGWKATPAAYGDTGFGNNDITANPQLRNAAVTLSAYDTAQGGDGTIAHFIGEVVKVNGFDTSGVAASFNSAFSITNMEAYIANGLTPQSAAYKGTGVSGVDIGAFAVVVSSGQLVGGRLFKSLVGGGLVQ